MIVLVSLASASISNPTNGYFTKFKLHPVDKSRIYCTGFSMGGVEAEKMVNEYPELFAAVAPMAAFPEIYYCWYYIF